MMKREIIILTAALVVLPFASVIILSQNFVGDALNLRDKTQVAALIDGLTVDRLFANAHRFELKGESLRKRTVKKSPEK